MSQRESPINDKAAVTVRLTARDARPDFVVPEREITLTKAKPTTQVGRASKQQSKGFVAEKENAWFESPVMSREHAELSADFETKTVLIKDIGSLHGTFHRSKEGINEDKLLAEKMVPLKHGDTLRFGTDIYRGQLTFPPCTVHVELRWKEVKTPMTKIPESSESTLTQSALSNRATPTNTFCVPDFDDDDDDDDNDGESISPDELMEINKSSTEEMNVLTNLERNNTIDLTIGTPSVRFSSSKTLEHLDSDVIDLVSVSDESLFMAEQPFSEADVEEVTKGGYEYESHASSSPCIARYTESEDNDVASGHSQTGDITKSIIKTPLVSDICKVAGINSFSFEYSPVLDEESSSEVNWTSHSTTSIYSDDSASEMEDKENFEKGCDQDMSDDQSAAAESNGEYSTSDELDEEDEEKSESLDNIPYWDEDDSTSESEEEKEEEEEEEAVRSCAFESHHIPLVAASSSPISASAPVCSGALKLLNSSGKAPFNTVCGNPVYSRGPTAPFIPVRPTHTPTFSQTPLFVDQHGSPSIPKGVLPNSSTCSNAVMDKTNNPKPIPSATAQALGERTGKYEFFAARDYNRASVISNPLIPQVPSTDESNIACNWAVNKSITVDDKKAGVITMLASTTSTHTAVKKTNDALTMAPDELHRHERTHKPPVTTIRSSCPPWREPEVVKEPLPDIVLESRHGLNQPPLVRSRWTPVGEAFLKEPTQCHPPVSDERTRLQSPELDMTSAATFAESKKKSVIDDSHSRRRLAVKFLLSHESKETSPTPLNTNDSNSSPRPLKRAFDEVFSEPEEQLISPITDPFMSLDNSAIILSEMNSSKPADVSTAVAHSGYSVPKPTEKTPKESTVVNHSAQAPIVRPAKRRRFSKFAKYASVSLVSGVTSAALVFAGLAATAPQIV